MYNYIKQLENAISLLYIYKYILLFVVLKIV